MAIKTFPKTSYKMGKIVVGSALLVGLSLATMAYAKNPPLKTVESVELDRYLGVWYEVARKPLYFQNKCDRDVSATYTLNENGNVNVDNKCYSKDGKLNQSIGEAFVQNAPANSKLKVSFLPSAIRWLPLGRGDYWVLKIDADYRTALVGEPYQKYLWLLHRDVHLNDDVKAEYLAYAQSLGYQLDDLIHTVHTGRDTAAL